MSKSEQFYIDGAWVEPIEKTTLDVLNPANGEVLGRISLGSAADADRAVAAARKAFPAFSQTSRAERIALLKRIIEVYQSRYAEMAKVISDEMGAPMKLATDAQAATGIGHLSEALRVLEGFEFEEDLGTTRVFKEPIGVCAFITPWNWPINQIACKVAPALAVGCTMVLKPSEIAPLSATLFAEILEEAGVPAGVFNLVQGDGPTVGARLSAHPEVDMVSFTGSTRAGTLVAKAAADSVKRVCQELGGKSANILLDDVDFQRAVSKGVIGCMMNTGQSCNAPTRMLVPEAKLGEAAAIAKKTAESLIVGDPKAEGTVIGPVVSEAQFAKIQGLIQAGIDEGAELVCGGVGKPEGLEAGCFVKPTVFSGVKNDMTIAREEIFGPVLSILGYRDEADAVAIANDTPYGLSGYVAGGDLERARKVASQLRTGMVHVNGAGVDIKAPFGGYKQSGNGREWGAHGFDDFLEVKAVMGYAPA